MSIKVSCSCGSRFSARSELQGKTVKCPSCQSPLTVPGPSRPSGDALVAQCPACASRFKAPARLLGKSTACPTCKQPFVVRNAPQASPPRSAAPQHDDLWDELEPQPQALDSQASMPQSSRSQSSTKAKAKSNQSGGYTLREGRSYVHDTCGQATCITGGDFRGLCNPLYRSGETFCVHCNTTDRYRSFSWQDTGESLTAYRRRLKQSAPLWMQHVRHLMGVVGLIVGGVIGFSLGMGQPFVAGGVGALVGGVLGMEALGPVVLSLLPGTQFYKQR